VVMRVIAGAGYYRQRDILYNDDRVMLGQVFVVLSMSVNCCWPVVWQSIFPESVTGSAGNCYE
ncbi:uncharacterized protein METZ01_LOCUS286656, partial [marine metagenome]